jgi:hypothetical protein
MDELHTYQLTWRTIDRCAAQVHHVGMDIGLVVVVDAQEVAAPTIQVRWHLDPHPNPVGVDAFDLDRSNLASRRIDQSR